MDSPNGVCRADDLPTPQTGLFPHERIEVIAAKINRKDRPARMTSSQTGYDALVHRECLAQRLGPGLQALEEFQR